jgi:hypothetical protein
LLPGTLLDRFGGPGGRFLSPIGTPYPMRSVRPSTAARAEQNIYRVLQPLEVEAGRAAPWFDEPGGGIQYFSGRRFVADLVRDGMAPLLFSWV